MDFQPTSTDKMTRIRSDYLGIGNFLVLPDGAGVVVNTTYGIQAVGHDSKVLWQLELGERCLGLDWHEDGSFLATTLHALHHLDATGDLIDSRRTRHEVASSPVAWRDGALLITLSRTYAIDGEGNIRWKLKYQEYLGESVRATLPVSVFVLDDAVILGVVDYNSGLGQILHVTDTGTVTKVTEVGPLTSMFLVGSDELVYTFSGYGRFESHRTGFGGESRWHRPFGGPGLEMPDGSLTMLVGNNESPTWDDWELRFLEADGTEIYSARTKGQCRHAPVLAEDGNLYFTSFFKPLDPESTRLDYTSFAPHPLFVAFDLLMRVKSVAHDHEVYYFKATTDGDLELLYKDTESLALGPTMARDGKVFFVHNRDLLVLDL
jgi:hypothetical protein